MQVKTIMTAAGVNEIDFGNDGSQSTAHFYWLKNLGSSTLYVSVNPNPVAEKDDVAELPAKGAVSVETDEGKVYVLGAGKVEIHRTNSKFCPFEWASSGSGGGGTIDAYSKTESDAKYAQKTDIPTSLPANGGDADYAAVARDTQLFNGKPSDNYVQFRGIIQVDDMSAVPADVYEYVNDSSYKVAYEVAINPLVSEFVGLPHIWWHIKYYVYAYGNGFSCQTAFPVGFGGVPYIRYSQEGVWSDWKEISTTPIKTDTITSNSDGAGYVWLPQGNGRKYISAIAHAYTHSNMYIDGTTGSTNLQIPDAINSAVTIDIAWIE